MFSKNHIVPILCVMLFLKHQLPFVASRNWFIYENILCESIINLITQEIQNEFQDSAKLSNAISQRLGSLQKLRLRFMARLPNHLRHFIRGLSQRCIDLGSLLRVFQLTSLAYLVCSVLPIKRSLALGMRVKRSLVLVRDTFPPIGQKEYQTCPDGASLFELAKDVTPQLANYYLKRGVQIDKAEGPEGETVWHAVVKYNGRPNEMLDWLVQNSTVPCNLTSSDGNTPLMLAIQLGEVESAKRLIKYGDLNVANSLTKLTAPELAAKNQSPESVDIFDSIMSNLSLNGDNERELAKRIPRAICNGLYSQEQKLRLSKIRKDKVYPSQVQEHIDGYKEQFSIAERHALQKTQSFMLAIKAFDTTSTQ